MPLPSAKPVFHAWTATVCSASPTWHCFTLSVARLLPELGLHRLLVLDIRRPHLKYLRIAITEAQRWRKHSGFPSTDEMSLAVVLMCFKVVRPLTLNSFISYYISIGPKPSIKNLRRAHIPSVKDLASSAGTATHPVSKRTNDRQRYTLEEASFLDRWMLAIQ